MFPQGLKEGRSRVGTVFRSSQVILDSEKGTGVHPRGRSLVIQENFVSEWLVMGMFSKDLKRGRRLSFDNMRKGEKVSKEDFYPTADYLR